MPGTVQIRFGDMFDGPSDLIVVPCSTDPTISKFVQARLQMFRIPHPTTEMHLGDVKFMPLEGAEHVAAWVAFAASVRGYTSTTGAIGQIAAELGCFVAREEGVTRISAPLLGAGAGRLDPRAVLACMKRGFLAHAPDAAVLNIFIPNRELYDELSGAKEVSREVRVAAGSRSGGDAHPRPVRVLISYTKTDPAHTDWVKSLATHLRQNGIDARLDIWHLRPGMDVAQWMCNEIDLAERVLLICNEEYARRADGRHGGVGWEIRIVQGDLLFHQKHNPDKYIPIVRTPDVESGLPTFLKTTYCLHWPPGSDLKKQTELLKFIYRKAEEAPPIGQPPVFVL